MSADFSQRRLKDAARRGYVPPTASRSLNMAAVKRSATKPELELRKALHAVGYRFRKYYPIRVGSKLIRPDIAFTKLRDTLFGCPGTQHCPRYEIARTEAYSLWPRVVSTSGLDPVKIGSAGHTL